MANRKINELQSRTPALSDLMLVGDPSSGYSYKCTVTALATIIETDIADGYVTIGTTQTISGAKTFSNNLTLTSVANATTTQTKFLTLNGSNVVNYRTGAEVLSDIGGASAALYVPYTGATTNVVLGMNNISANNLNVQPTGFGVLASLTRDISGSGYGILLLRNGANGYLQPSVMGVDRTWTLPNASGTIALTSDLSSYVPTSRTITINGTTFDLNANRTWSVGTVTSVSATAGTGISISGSPITGSGTLTITNTAPDQTVVLTAGTGISVSGTYPNFTITNSSPSSGGTVTSVGLSSATSGVTIGSSPITTSGTITLAIATASGTQQGLLSSTDWTTFNNKQNALTLTTTGTSGAATLVGSTLNIPQYQAALTNPVTGTGTTNYIPKFTSSSAIGNSQIFDNGTNVGIGTTSPAVKLQVIGDIATSTRVVTDLINGYTGGSTPLTIQTGGAQSIVFGTTNTERMRLDASGNLGLGTSAPSGQFHTYTSGDKQLLVTYPSTFATRLTIGNAAFYIQNDASPETFTFVNSTGSGIFDWKSGASATQRMRLDASGNLGLGTSTPSSFSGYTTLSINNATNGAILNLLVNGTETGRFQAYANTLVLAAKGATSNMLFETNGSERMRLDASGNLGLGTSSPSTKLDVFGDGAKFGNGSDFYFTANTGTTGNYYHIQNGAIRLTLTASGNLGLGVTPSAWSSSWKAFEFAAAAMAWTGGGANDFSFSTNSFFDATDSRWEYKSTGDGAARYSITALTSEHRWYNAPIGTAGNAISFTQAMTLFSTGNLAVGGTSDAGQRLQITGAARITAGGNTYATSGLILGSAGVSSGYISTTDNLYIKPNQAANSASGAVSIQNFSESTVIHLSTNGSSYFNAGNVGIGTTNPLYKLVVSNGGAEGIEFGAGYISGRSLIQAYNRSGASYNGLDFSANSYTFSNGNVGIGTTSPARALEVNGIGKFMNTVTLGGTSGSSNFNVYLTNEAFANNNNATEFTIGTASASNIPIIFATNASERMRITSGGDIGIGVTSPGAKLEVNGAIKTAAPSGGNAAPWKLGSRVAATVVFDTSQYIQLDINGTLYYLATVTLP